MTRGKEGNEWCQTPVRLASGSLLACAHHKEKRHARVRQLDGEHRRLYLAASEFLDHNGRLKWRAVLEWLRRRQPERLLRKSSVKLGEKELSVREITVVVHGFEDCLFFWLSACVLARRGYTFKLVAHADRTTFKAELLRLTADAGFQSMSHQTSPLLLVSHRRENTRYYVGGHSSVRQIF